MYAIIEDSGTQIQVRSGEIVDLDIRDLDEGAKSITLDRVLMLGNPGDETASAIGQPYVDGASVTAEILGEVKGEKVEVFQFKRRKGHRRKLGHRQRYLRVRIKDIKGKLEA